MPRPAAVALIVCAVVLTASPSPAQYFGRNKVHYDTLTFRVLQTEHFDLYYYESETEAARYAARMAERWYTRFSRLFDHTFTRRQPLVLYESHAHFSQTNVTGSVPGESVGGITEQNKARIAMPFAAGLGETDHVLGHEIAHTFQIDIAKRAHQSAFSLPAWAIEGMAEFLSLGPINTNTTMWLRDAERHDRLPTIRQLGDPRYFPYRYGHALWAWLGETYGDEITAKVLRSRVSGMIPRLEKVTGRTRDELTRDWHASIRSLRAPAASLPAGTPLLKDSHSGRLQVGPALSPDGTKLMFLSERDRVSLGLFLADAVSGRVIDKVASTGADTHFDSLQDIQSAGAWDRTGRQFVFAAIRRGRSILSIVEPGHGGGGREFPLPSLGEISSPAWSPDGTRIVFSALKGGLSDLFVFTIATKELRQVTADAFTDLQPVWSPDGRTIAFASDRFTTSLDQLRFGALRLGLLDVESRAIRQPAPDETSAKQINPQWSPQGDTVYFLSDADGRSNVHRVALATGVRSQITDAGDGISGITPLSPALAVSASTGRLAFSVYTGGGYEIRSLLATQVDADPVSGRLPPSPDGFGVPEEAGPPPSEPSSDATADDSRRAGLQTRHSLVSLLADATTGLPDAAGFRTSTYDDRLRLESVLDPYVGASTSSAFGGILQASFGVMLADTLRDRQLQTLVRAGTTVNDLAAQIAYVTRRSQWNRGVSGGVLPLRFAGAKRSIARDGDLLTREMSHLRYLHEWVQANATYNVSRTSRVELGTGIQRTGVTWQTMMSVQRVGSRSTLDERTSEAPAGPALYLADAHVALVHDTAVFGATSPIAGRRLRLELAPALGSTAHVDVNADARGYVMPFRPVTIAVRVEHRGRYGTTDPRLPPLVGNLQSFVRGYDLESFAADTCGRTATSCSVVDQIRGSRLALANVELRAPLVGLLTGRLDYGSLPIEAIAFADAGFLWTRPDGNPVSSLARFRSVGAGARINAGGIVLEITAARPLDRKGLASGRTAGWTTSFLMRPGF